MQVYLDARRREILPDVRITPTQESRWRARFTGDVCADTSRTNTVAPLARRATATARTVGGARVARSISVFASIRRTSTSSQAPQRGFTKRGESGGDLTRHFCPECGSPIFTSSPKHPKHVYVKAGTLDDPNVVKPAHENWVASAVSWSQIHRNIARFTRGPE